MKLPPSTIVVEPAVLRNPCKECDLYHEDRIRRWEEESKPFVLRDDGAITLGNVPSIYRASRIRTIPIPLDPTEEERQGFALQSELIRNLGVSYGEAQLTKNPPGRTVNSVCGVSPIGRIECPIRGAREDRSRKDMRLTIFASKHSASIRPISKRLRMTSMLMRHCFVQVKIL